MFRTNLQNLMNAIVNSNENTEDAKDDMEFLNERIEKFPAYVDSVVSYISDCDSASVMLAAGMIDTDTYQYRVHRTDESRRNSHDVAMNAMKQINRLCDLYKVDHICPEENMHREDKADFAALVTIEMFMEGVNKPEEAIQKVMDGYHALDEVVELVKGGAKITC